MNGRGKDLVIFAALLGAAAWGTWLFLRMQLDLGSGWTDGAVRYDRLADERVRFAIWDEPEPLPASVNSPASEARPALSPDGRYLVYTAGERGLNADLYVAELPAGTEGEPAEPRPLTSVNSPFDELAPAFGPDGLYFATNRSGSSFGLDLWRAPYSGGVFGAPEPIGSGINTFADESDPYPVPGTRDLLFASDRRRGARSDFELYLASPTEEERTFEVAPLDRLNSPFDEREPTLTADGRTVIFASDREGTAGDFDLFRSFLEDGEWLKPDELFGINTPGSERGPLLSPDGFSLYFDAPASNAVEGTRDLWRARSLELFRVPGPPLSLQEVLLLIGLFLLALLGWLSKRWRTLDIIYKCTLISLLIHFLLMWFLREVYPEQGPAEIPGEERLFRVRLAPSASGTPSESQERNGELLLEARAVETPESAPSRAESGAELAAAAPTRKEFDTPERELEAPTRSDALLSENRSAEVAEAALQEREAPMERLAQNAPGLALQSQETAAAPTQAQDNSPNRASTTTQTLQATPSAVRMETSREPAESGRDDPGPVRLARSATPTVQGETSVAQPTESFEAARAAAPSLALPEVTAVTAPRREAGSAARSRQERSAPTAELGEAQPSNRSPADLAPNDAREAIPQRSELSSSETTVARGDPAVDVRRIHEAPTADLDARESVRFDATADLAQSEATRAVPAASDPQRFDVSPSRTSRENAQPTTRDLAGLAPRRDAAQTETVARSDALKPGEAASSAAPEVAVRSVEESLPRPARDLPEPKRFDPAADLARSEPQRFRPAERTNEPQPRRFEREAAEARALPERAAIAAVAPLPSEEPDDLPRRLEHTPYKNRFGQEKLRALDEYGGGVETERAVAAGLAYLAGIQGEQGNWGERRDHHDKYGDVRIGKTGLALLAFLGAGHTPVSGTEYSEVTDRAIRFLQRMQDDRSGHFGDSSSYSHAIATYALAECFAITAEKRLRATLEPAIAQVLRNQNRNRDARLYGGWGYYYKNDRVWNNDAWPRVSVTAWQVMALESARIGGLTVPDSAFDAARDFIMKAWDPRFRAFRYSHDPDRLRSGYPILPASTPAGLFALSLLGIDAASSELVDARRFILQRAPRDYRYTSDDDFVQNARGNLYFWYYGTLSMFRVGGSDWERWNTAMKETLLEGQERDGSWEPISIYCEYAGDDDAERTYSTAMCVLTLEVYYRYFTPLLEVR